MAIDDVVFQTTGLTQAAGDKYYAVNAGFLIIQPGEPVSVSGTNTSSAPTQYAYSLYNSSVSASYQTGTAKPVVGTDLICGIAQEVSTQSTSSSGATGYVHVTSLVPGMQYRSRFSLHKVFTFTANFTTTSYTFTSVSSTVGLVVGQAILDNTNASYIPNGTVITSINSASSTITVSQLPVTASTGDTIQVYAPALSFVAATSTASTTVTPSGGTAQTNGLLANQVVTDSTTAANIPAGTTISTVTAGTSITLSANATATHAADVLIATLLTTDGQTVTQAQYNALVNCQATFELYVNPLDGKSHYHILPNTVASINNGLVIRYLDVVKYPGQVAFEIRNQVSDTN